MKLRNLYIDKYGEINDWFKKHKRHTRQLRSWVQP
jgi:hypothetical protein